MRAGFWLKRPVTADQNQSKPASLAVFLVEFMGSLYILFCDVRIAICFALLSDANALWYDHATNSIK